MNNIISGSYSSIVQAANYIGNSNRSANTNDEASNVSFANILNQKKSIEEMMSETESASSVKFSKHAGERLEQRDIHLTKEQLSRLEEGTKKASEKGIKDSLVLLDDMAFIVNTQNKTVITAMNSDSNDDNIYTNIDGAVII